MYERSLIAHKMITNDGSDIICEGTDVLILILLNVVSGILFLASEYIGKSSCHATGVFDALLSTACNTRRKKNNDEEKNIVAI